MRIFTVLLSVFVLHLYTLLVAAAAVWGWRTWVEPPHVVSAVRPEKPLVGRAEAEPDVQPQPVAVKTAPPAAPKTEPAAAEQRPVPVLQTWDPKTVMANSRAGKTLSKYAADYDAVMDANVRTLKAALAEKDPGLNTAEARRLIEEYQKRRITIHDDIDVFLRTLVGSAAAGDEELKSAPLVENSAITRAAESRDVSERLCAILDAVSVNMPPMPKAIVRRKAPAAASKKQPAAPKAPQKK